MPGRERLVLPVGFFDVSCRWQIVCFILDNDMTGSNRPIHVQRLYINEKFSHRDTIVRIFLEAKGYENMIPARWEREEI